MKLKRLITTALAAIMSFACIGAAACGEKKPSGNGTTIRITFYEGGYGRQWLVNAADDFKAKKAAEGVEVDFSLEGDATITATATNLLRAGTNLSDIYMTQGNEWSSFVTQGYLAPLTNAYEMEVEKLDGSKVKVKDYLIDELENYPYMRRLAGQGDLMPWVMPWGLLETSIIYNETLLKKTKHTTTVQGSWAAGDLWTEAPKTMAELEALCADINAASGTDVYGGKKVAPLSWAGGGINYFENVIFVLWAQQQGIDTSMISGEGSFYDFWNFETPDVWKQSGIQGAIDEWRDIVVDADNKTWKNSIDNAEQKIFQDSARLFCNQEAVLLLGGSFFENEWKSYLSEVEKFDFKMMNIPLSDNARVLDAEGNKATINFCSSNDIMFVPAKATNVDLAVEFLGFMCNEKYMLDFSKQTGCLRPFDYDPVELTKDDSSVVWSDFFYSCYNMKKNADYNIFTYPVSAAKNDKVSLYYTYYKPELFTGPGVSTAMLKLKELNGKQLMIDGDATFSSVSVRAAKSWNDWSDSLGLNG